MAAKDLATDVGLIGGLGWATGGAVVRATIASGFAFNTFLARNALAGAATYATVGAPAVGMGMLVAGFAMPAATTAALAVKFTMAMASGASAHEALTETITLDPKLLGSGVNFWAFFSTGGEGGQYCPPEAGWDGARSSDGAAGEPRGPGIDGSTQFARTIVAENTPRPRELIREETEFTRCVGPERPGCVLVTEKTRTSWRLPLARLQHVSPQCLNLALHRLWYLVSWGLWPGTGVGSRQYRCSSSSVATSHTLRKTRISNFYKVALVTLQCCRSNPNLSSDLVAVR